MMNLKYTIIFLVLVQSYEERNVIRNKRYTLNNNSEEISINNNPIIGILSQEVNQEFEHSNQSYIAASYVKFVEGSGARAAPIWIGKDESYYEDILSKVNGVLFPGGDALFNKSNGYAEAGKYIYKIAKRLNNNGDYFPVLGICLGFELITFLEANSTEHRIPCNGMKLAIPLEFKNDFCKSRLFNQIPKDTLNILKYKNVTANYHNYCVTEQALNKMNTSKAIHVLSTNKDWSGKEFISTLELTNYPIYGLQFHPEKNNYEWVLNRNVPHGISATKVGQYFANFFVNEARKNNHSFSNLEEEQQHLIYNYPVSYTALQNSVFLQKYFFN